MTRAIIHMQPTASKGEVLAVRVLVQHPMETGYRSGSRGEKLPRNILRRLQCRFDGALVFAAELHPAIAANPTIAFQLRAVQSGTLSVNWAGDNGFDHTETASLTVL